MPQRIGFIKNECFNKAAALTFYSLLAVIPILAVAFGFAKGFGFENYLENVIVSNVIEEPDLAKRAIAFSYSMLEHAHSGLIAAVGLIVLFYTAIQLIGNIEHSLNVIWEVKNPRSYPRQIIDYLMVVILCPIFFVASSSFSVFTITELHKVAEEHSTLHLISPFILFLLQLIPYVMSWLLFSFIYIFLPNTQVKWWTAVIASLIAGTAYQIVQWTYIHFQIGVANYGAVYGSFAAVPLFLVWLNLSWQIVLAGAELAFHMEVTPKISDTENYKFMSKKDIGLWILSFCAEEFLKDGDPVTVNRLAKEFDVSLQVVREIVYQLSQKGLLTEDKHYYLRIAKNPENIN